MYSKVAKLKGAKFACADSQQSYHAPGKENLCPRILKIKWNENIYKIELKSKSGKYCLEGEKQEQEKLQKITDKLFILFWITFLPCLKSKKKSKVAQKPPDMQEMSNA